MVALQLLRRRLQQTWGKEGWSELVVSLWQWYVGRYGCGSLLNRCGAEALVVMNMLPISLAFLLVAPNAPAAELLCSSFLLRLGA